MQINFYMRTENDRHISQDVTADHETNSENLNQNQTPPNNPHKLTPNYVEIKYGSDLQFIYEVGFANSLSKTSKKQFNTLLKAPKVTKLKIHNVDKVVLMTAKIDTILKGMHENLKIIAETLGWNISSSNPIEYINNFITMLKNEANRSITTLNLSDTSIRSLPWIISKFKHLQELNVSRTNVSILPDALQKVVDLSIISAVDTPLVEIPDWIKERGIEFLSHLKLDPAQSILD